MTIGAPKGYITECFLHLDLPIHILFFRYTIVKWKAIIFKKRYLPLIVLFSLLFTIGAIVTIKGVIDEHRSVVREHSPMVEVCRNALVSAGYTLYSCEGTEFHSTPRYQRIEFSLMGTVNVYFNDGVNDMSCKIYRRGSEWVVISKATTIAGMCP